MEDPNHAMPPPEAQPTQEGSPKDIELPPSRWDSPSPKPGTPERPASPEPHCAICLGALENKSFTNSCMHQFCFVCLLEWSKVKAECPLCKNTFKSIIHNVRSMEDYDQYEVLRPAPPDPAELAAGWVSWSLPQLAFGGMHVIPSGRRPPLRHGRDRTVAGTSAFRRGIYEDDLWARMQPDVTGRYRECSPMFYRMNPAQLHRLVPFLQRELNVLMPDSPDMPVIVEDILSKLRYHRITGREFRQYMRRLIGPRHAQHFCHELHAYASSPFDLIGYDRSTEYQPNNNNLSHPDLVEVIEDTASSSNSDTDDSDSDIQMLPKPTTLFGVSDNEHGESTSVTMRIRNRPTVSTNPSSPQPGPSGLNGARIQSPPRRPNCDSSVYVVDSSDSDECTIVGVVKPRHERTPVLITLSSPERDPETPDLDVGTTNPAEYDPQSGLATEPFDSDSASLSELLSMPDTLSPVLDLSVPTAGQRKGKVKSRRNRFNSSGSSSSSITDSIKSDSSHRTRWPSMSPSLSPSSNDSSIERKPNRRKMIWSSSDSSTDRKSTRRKKSRSSSESSTERKPSRRKKSRSASKSSSYNKWKLRLQSVATRVSPPRRRQRDREPSYKYGHSRYEESDSYEAAAGPSTSASSSSSRHRDRLTSVLQRTCTVTGEDIWTVNCSRGRRPPDSEAEFEDESGVSSPERSNKRKRSGRSDHSDSSSSSHCRRKRRDSSFKSKKNHSKKSKSKKRRKESRKDRCKKSSKHNADA